MVPQHPGSTNMSRLASATPPCLSRLQHKKFRHSGVPLFVLLCLLGSWVEQDASNVINTCGVVLGTGCYKPVWRFLSLSSEGYLEMLLVIRSFVGDFLGSGPVLPVSCIYTHLSVWGRPACGHLACAALMRFPSQLGCSEALTDMCHALLGSGDDSLMTRSLLGSI